MNIFRIIPLLLGLSMFLFASCNNTTPSNNEKVLVTTDGEKVEKRMVYEAKLESLNDHITGTQTNGLATFTIENNMMHIVIDVKDAPPNIEHWQHFHGFENAQNATCANSNDDANGDGIIDLIETEKKSGTTMVPFNELPAKLNIPDNSYPVADEKGNYRYEATVPMDELEDAFVKQFGEMGTKLSTRVIYIHGVPEDTPLPSSVASLGDIPAHVTLPIACGRIWRIE